MMKYIKQVESMVEGWLKKVPHLPKAGQKWLAENVWWIALIGAIAYGISILVTLSTIGFLSTALIGTSYYVPGFAAWSTIFAVVSLVFNIAAGVLLALSVQPLKGLTKKGWTLLFLVLLVDIVAVVVNALLSFVHAFTFGSYGVLAIGGVIIGLVFGAVFAAIMAYFLFEIRSHFAHVTKGAAKS